ncbi:MAG: hypothetical protein ACLGIR_07295 [Actinomycetes bacterium]
MDDDLSTPGTASAPRRGRRRLLAIAVLAGVAALLRSRRGARAATGQGYGADPGAVGDGAGVPLGIGDAPDALPEEVVAAVERPRTGDPADRGRAATVGLDVARLASQGELTPAVQYLTYIQSKRGDGSRMLFVRYDDLDAMAELQGTPTTEFLARLEQLGVVVSPN